MYISTRTHVGYVGGRFVVKPSGNAPAVKPSGKAAAAFA